MDTYSVNTADEPAGVVSHLATTLMDANKSYKTILENGASDLRPTVEDLIALHEAHTTQLLELYTELGGNPDAGSGSMMAAVHTAVAHARDLTGTADQSTLSDIIKGEESIVSHYADALGSMEKHERIRDVIAGQYQDLQSHLEKLRT